MDRKAGRRFAVIDLQYSAVLGLRRLRGRERQSGENSGRQCGKFCSHLILPGNARLPLPSLADSLFLAFYDANATRYGSPDQHDKR